MVISVPSNTYTYLQNARTKGLIVRDLVWFKARNRDTDALETVGIWSGGVAQTIDVIRPSDGAISNRVYQPGAGLMDVPAIPMTMSLEERRITLTFSNLSPAVLNAVRVYKLKGQPIEIHRLFLDPETMKQIDPAHVRFDGIVRKAPLRHAKVGNDGKILVQAVGHAATLRSNPAKLSEEFFKRRDGDGGGRFFETTSKLVWGQEIVVHEKRSGRRRQKWLR